MCEAASGHRDDTDHGDSICLDELPKKNHVTFDLNPRIYLIPPDENRSSSWVWSAIDRMRTIRKFKKNLLWGYIKKKSSEI